ncbi:MAG: GNAT family N-acetyltransferase [Acidobacteriota bacterium]|nr:GNAT family N-acetyltransferase [Acidobacteriota bacterium]
MFSEPLRDGFELRLVEERHAEEMFSAIESNREYLRQWLPWVDATQSKDDTQAFIRAALEMFAAQEGFTAAIWHRKRVAGVIGTHRIDWRNRRAELGYWLAQELQGRGLMSDACRLALAHLFDEMNLHRVEIRCAAGNAKSNAIPQRLGFKLEARHRDAELVNGRYHDLLVYAMLKSEWS